MSVLLIDEKKHPTVISPPLMNSSNHNRLQIGIGIEASAGIAGWNRWDFVFHYPSLSLFYNFGDSDRNTLFTPKKN